MRYLFLLALLAAPLSAQTSPTKIVTVPGKVVGPDGKAASGAEVLLEDGTQLRADAAGRFVAHAKPRAELGGYLGRVIARAPGLGLGGATLRMPGVTLRLSPAGTARGRVVDEKGAVVAGVVVQMEIIEPEQPSSDDYVFVEGTPWKADYATRTDADGRWDLPGVPTRRKIGAVILDERFARERVSVPVTEDTTFVQQMTANRGGVFHGRVIFADGRPAPGVVVSAQGQASQRGWGSAKSGADGQFAITGLAAGAYNVMIFDAKRLWVANAVEGALAQPGEPKTLRDFVLTPGVMLRGRVVDAATGKAIANVEIGSYGAQNPHSTGACVDAFSNAQGRFQLRVPSGETYVYLMGPPLNYINEHPSQTLDVAPDERREVVFKLHRGVVLRGVAVDEKGAVQRDVALRYALPGGVPQIPLATSDAKGEFASQALTPGKVTLGTDAPWQLLRPTQVQAKAGDGAPLRVVVRASPQTARFFKASAITSDGQPLSDVEMQLQILTPGVPDTGGYGSQNFTLRSDAQGRFVYEKLQPRQQVMLSLSKPGYRLMSGAQVTGKPEGITVSPAVFARMDGHLSGQVLDETGAPAAGAWLTVPESGESPRQIGADGRFSLENLPRGPISLLAARGRSAAREATKTGAEIQVKLRPAPPQPGQDIERGAQILESIAPDPAADKNYYAHGALAIELAPYDLERALQMARTKDGKLDDERAAELYSVALEANPSRAAELTPRVLALKPSAAKFRLLLPFLPDLVKTQPDAMAQLLTEAKTWLSARPQNVLAEGELWSQSRTAFFIAALSDLKRNGETDDWLARVLTITAKTRHEKPADGGQPMMLSLVVKMGLPNAPNLAERLLDKLPIINQEEALGSAISEAAPRDLPMARRLLERLRALPPRLAQEAGSAYAQDPELALGLPSKAVIAELGKTDPAGALQLAREVKSQYHRAEALALAARFQSKEQAVSLFREAGALTAGQNEGVENLARFGGWVYEFDAATAREFWDRALALRENNRFVRGGVDDIAFYMARDDAARARLLLENAFVRARTQPGSEGGSMIGCAMAMCAVDVDRALQMANEIPRADNFSHFEARRKIAQYLLAPPETRRTLAFNRWGASDTWRPGTATHW